MIASREETMKIILTHEQADFDAIASLLGAYLLDEACKPVLPRRMNRNVRAFLTLYGMEMPFLDPRDLPGDAISSVTLVDTQSMISVKGMTTDTLVHVIDHHPLREDIPRDWNITVFGTGANTTLFIEVIQERNILLSPIQATLLLIGIYEDTGSLTYSRTTARDLRVAGYLLDQGASLSIAADFLNHPLSSTQQQLYDHLQDNLIHYQIHGQTIVVACSDVLITDEELSTIAHKLRDLLDPDALFLLVETSGGVQLIARSTSDNINVAEVAGYFGGGGHERAAASLIKEKSIDEVNHELVELLPTMVTPAVTVGEIMSRGPQVLEIDTPVHVAAEQMRRFGHEGYPVVREGKVVGLLTRRAVDRAMSHRLNLNAGRLMESGVVTVRPDDSIDVLQSLMTDTGWGQIPVVDSDTGSIEGIVTRTDLLKTLTPTKRIPSRRNIAEKLRAALPPMRLALLLAVAEIAHGQRKAVFIVGGFVRDLLIEITPVDFDLVVEGDAIELAHSVADKYGGRVTSHSRFGTAKWFIANDTCNKLKLKLPGLYQEDVEFDQEISLPESLDFVTARTEFYSHPTALPTIEQGSIKLDLHRRDFTINTLALQLDGPHYGKLHDYWGGLYDLNNGVIRVLHSLSFIDDPTRILRAARFEQRFGFRIDSRTLVLLKEALPLLDRVSGDRIRHELDSILIEKNVAKELLRLFELGVLKQIHPDLVWDNWLSDRFSFLAAGNYSQKWFDLRLRKGDLEYTQTLYTIWCIRLEQSQVIGVIKRLKLAAKLKQNIFSACQLWSRLDEVKGKTPSEIVSVFDSVPPIALQAAYFSTSDEDIKYIFEQYINDWVNISPSLTGHDLQQLGIPPGPQYKTILQNLRNARLDGVIVDDEDELALLNHLLAK